MADDAVFPNLPLLEPNRELVIAQARTMLESGLRSVWPKSYVLPAGNLQGQGVLPCFEQVFLDYAIEVLKECAQKMEALDAETVLETLRGRAIPCICDGMEPNWVAWANNEASMWDDATPTGEWERWLEKTYHWFRSDQPPQYEPAELDVESFRFRFQFWLRDAEHRRAFRRKLEIGMERQMVRIEAELRARLPVRVMRAAPGGHGRPRGYPANEDDHRKVVQAVEGIGAEWKSHLSELSRELSRVGADIPRRLKKEYGCETWEDVGDVLTKAPERGIVIHHIQYRLKWRMKSMERVSEKSRESISEVS